MVTQTTPVPILPASPYPYLALNGIGTKTCVFLLPLLCLLLHLLLLSDALAATTTMSYRTARARRQ